MSTRATTLPVPRAIGLRFLDEARTETAGRRLTAHLDAITGHIPAPRSTR